MAAMRFKILLLNLLRCVIQLYSYQSSQAVVFHFSCVIAKFDLYRSMLQGQRRDLRNLLHRVSTVGLLQIAGKK